jgi:hypothetical protein
MTWIILVNQVQLTTGYGQTELQKGGKVFVRWGKVSQFSKRHYRTEFSLP